MAKEINTGLFGGSFNFDGSNYVHNNEYSNDLFNGAFNIFDQDYSGKKQEVNSDLNNGSSNVNNTDNYSGANSGNEINFPLTNATTNVNNNNQYSGSVKTDVPQESSSTSSSSGGGNKSPNGNAKRYNNLKSDKYVKTTKNSDGGRTETFDNSQYNLDSKMAYYNNHGYECVGGAKAVFNSLYGDGAYAPYVGSAYKMDNLYANNSHYVVNTTPSVGAMLVQENGTYVPNGWTVGNAGHVEIVKSITYNADGSVRSITTVGSNQKSASHTYTGKALNTMINNGNVHFIAAKK